MQRDLEYFAQRARAERLAAARCACVKSKAAHEELAARYEDVLRAYGYDPAGSGDAERATGT